MFSAVTLVTMSRLRANVRAGMHRKGQAIATHLVLSQSQCFASAARSMTVPVQFQCQSARIQLQHSPSDRKLDKSADCISGLNSVAAAVTGHSPAFAHDRSSLDDALLKLPVSSGLGDSDRILHAFALQREALMP